MNRAAEALNRVPNTPPECVTIYTNEKSAIHFLTDHRAFAIPEKTDPVKAETRSYHEETAATMRARLATGLRQPDELRTGMPPKEEITFELVRLLVFNDAELYVASINSD